VGKHNLEFNVIISNELFSKKLNVDYKKRLFIKCHEFFKNILKDIIVVQNVLNSKIQMQFLIKLLDIWCFKNL
jgi:hypothetical protein